jgi:hypothetical protein
LDDSGDVRREGGRYFGVVYILALELGFPFLILRLSFGG